MRAVDVVTEVCLASAEEAMRFSHFVQAFLSRNGFPFIMIHNAPDLTGERRRVEFEDPSISRRFAQEWRSVQPTA
ncbi:hypothetical protein [Caulobacter sp. LARHSG274]